MNPRTVFSLALVMVCLLACDLPGIIQEITRSDSEPPAGQSPAQTANGTAIGPQTPAGQPPTLTANGTALRPQTPAGQPPTLAANDKGLGPQTLDAADPDLVKQHTSSVSSYDQDLYEGFDKSGAPYKLSYDRFHMEQIEPKWGYYSHISVIRNGKVDPAAESEMGQLNGKNFSVKAGKCGTSPDTSTHKPSNSFFVGMQDIRGKLNRVENGVVINGALTDRYEIQSANLHGWTRAVEFKPSSLYRAREGGYLVSLVYAVLDQYDSGRTFEKDFDPSKPVLITLRHDLTYYATTTPFIQLPALCVGK
jgi:hypothetical protein